MERKKEKKEWNIIARELIMKGKKKGGVAGGNFLFF